jgi:hypothetical protein
VKVYRSKRRSCKWCKPHKMGFAPRWTAKELDKIRRMVNEAHQR